MKKHVQTDSEWQEEMSQKIIDEIQCELYLDMPFYEAGALGSFTKGERAALLHGNRRHIYLLQSNQAD